MSWNITIIYIYFFLKLSCSYLTLPLIFFFMTSLQWPFKFFIHSCKCSYFVQFSPWCSLQGNLERKLCQVGTKPIVSQWLKVDGCLQLQLKDVFFNQAVKDQQIQHCERANLFFSIKKKKKNWWSIKILHFISLLLSF